MLLTVNELGGFAIFLGAALAMWHSAWRLQSNGVAYAKRLRAAIFWTGTAFFGVALIYAFFVPTMLGWWDDYSIGTAWRPLGKIIGGVSAVMLSVTLWRGRTAGRGN